jgi:hypothetical protein
VGLAATIEKALGIEVRLEKGKPGQFEVYADGKLVAGKDPVPFLKRLLGNKGIPPASRVIAELEGLS